MILVDESPLIFSDVPITFSKITLWHYIVNLGYFTLSLASIFLGYEDNSRPLNFRPIDWKIFNNLGVHALLSGVCLNTYKFTNVNNIFYKLWPFV